MAGSLKDALTKVGAVAPDEPKPKLETKKWRDELPEEVTFPPPFDAPALLKVTERAKPPKK